MRILQVLGDTDEDDDGRAALDLHRALTDIGVEVRTLALAPGRQAGLASEVPTMSPSARSLAAHTQLRREQRWADVVLLRGEAPASAAGLARVRNAPPTVLQLGADAAAWIDGPVPSRAARALGRVDAVVVTSVADLAVADRLGLRPDELTVVPYGVPIGPVVSPARRSAARAALGLPAAGLVAHLVGGGARLAAARTEAERRGVLVTEIVPEDDRLVRFGDVEEPDRHEVAVAAADLVVLASTVTAGPPPTVLRAAAAGLAVVAEATGAVGDLLDATTGWIDLERAQAAGVDEVHRRGAAAAERVAERFAATAVAARWHDLLSRVADR